MRKILSILTIVILLISCSKDEVGGNFFSDIKDSTWLSTESINLNGETMKVFLTISSNGTVYEGYENQNGNHVSCTYVNINDQFQAKVLKNSKSVFIRQDEFTFGSNMYFMLSKNDDKIKYIYSASEDINDKSSYTKEYSMEKTSMNYERSMSMCVD